jgi:hypothetical protein
MGSAVSKMKNNYKNYRNLEKVIAIVVMAAFLFQVNISSNLYAQSREELDKQFHRAREQYNQKQYVNAGARIERLISIIEKRPDQKELLGQCCLLLGAIYEKEGEIGLAEENYRKAKEYGIKRIDGINFGDLPLYKKIAGIIEVPTTPPQKKRFPWLLAVGGVVVVGVVLYFLVLKPKKKYQLTVEVDEGVTGTPEAGTYEYKKGSTVNYSYTEKTNYTGLEVELDGRAIQSSGSFKIERNHILRARSRLIDYTFEFVTDKDELTIIEGQTAAFQVKLSAQLPFDVAANITVSGDSDIQLQSSPTLTFTSSDWNIYREVTLEAAPDEDNINDQAVVTIEANGLASTQVIVNEHDLQGDSKPLVKIEEPDNRDSVDNDVVISGTAVDSDGSIEKIDLYIDDKLVETFSSNTFEYEWSTRNYEIKWHEIKAIAYDIVGNFDKDDIVVYVADSLPSAEIILPVPPETPLSGTVTFTVNAEDYRGIQSVKVLMGNDEIAVWKERPRTSVTFDVDLDTTKYEDGIYALKAVAIDTGDQESEPFKIAITIKNH